MTERFEIHQKNLEKLFYPDSIAVIGANKVQGTVPYDIFYNILSTNFNGVVFPVSPREKFIAGVKCYKYVIDIEDPVDLAILVFPAPVCHMALEQCGQKGIKSVIIISAGFKEIGSTGLDREQQLLKIAKKYDISFIGPNCLGVINTDPRSRLNASFARRMPIEGSIGFLSQSGALCTAVLDYAYAKFIGFSKFISFGNKADISEIDLLYYLMRDEKTKVILLYLEEVSDGHALMKAANEAIMKYKKPVLILKSGRTKEGASAAASHTGSLAGSDEICDAAFKQAGIIRCNNIEEMFNKAIAFAYLPLPLSNNIAIITNAGGPGVLTTDAAIRFGLKLAKFSEETTKTLRRSLPSTANIKNPVDVIGDARDDRYNAALSAAFKDDNVDGVFVILTPQSMTEIDLIAREIAKVSSHYDKPVLTSFMGEADVRVGIDILQRNKIPHYSLPESMAEAFACAYNFRQLLDSESLPPQQFNVDKQKAIEILTMAKNARKSYVTEWQSALVLKAYGLPVLDGLLVKTEAEAAEAASKIGFPVVMKIMSPDIVHKFDVKGVVLDITSEELAKKAYRDILGNLNICSPEANVEGIYVTKQIPKGEEIILGVKRDLSFGPVVMFGLGGIFVEIFKDVSFRVAPVNYRTVRGMIEEIKAFKILSGTRGRNVRDIEAITECILRLSQLAIECQDIKELDINPLIVLDENHGCFVADAKIML